MSYVPKQSQTPTQQHAHAQSQSQSQSQHTIEQQKQQPIQAHHQQRAHRDRDRENDTEMKQTQMQQHPQPQFTSQQQRQHQQSQQYQQSGHRPTRQGHEPQQRDSFLEHVVRCSLADLLDKTLIVLLRDGKKYIGILLSFDQFSNVVLGNVVERRVLASDGIYHDVPIGLFIIRGENIVLMGTHDTSYRTRDFKHVDKSTFDIHYSKYLEKQKRIEDAMRELLGSEGRNTEEDDLV